MSPNIEIVCECPCNGCMFHSVCWSKGFETSFGFSEVCIDLNFCSKNFIVSFDAPTDVSDLLTL